MRHDTFRGAAPGRGSATELVTGRAPGLRIFAAR